MSYENYKNNLWIENEVPCLIRFYFVVSTHKNKYIQTQIHTWMHSIAQRDRDTDTDTYTDTDIHTDVDTQTHTCSMHHFC